MKIDSAGIETHFHNLDSFNIEDIAKVMNKNQISVIAIESRNPNFFPDLKEDMLKNYGITSDLTGFIFSNKCFLNAVEYNTIEKFHVLVIGQTPFEKYNNIEIRRLIDSSLELNSLVIIAHPFVDNGITKKTGHIDLETENILETICGEYGNQIALEWNAYSNPSLRFLLKNGLNLLGHKTKYSDTNKKSEELSKYLEYRGINVPIVTGTDSHPKNLEDLLFIGKSRMIMDIEGESAQEVISSIKKNIFKKNYKNIKSYSNIPHIIKEIAFPYISEYIYQKIK